MENAVTETRVAAARYAYPKLVTAPAPKRPANGELRPMPATAARSGVRPRWRRRPVAT